MKLTVILSLFLVLIAAVSFLTGQSAKPPSASENRVRPRPTPPSCCTPFRTDEDLNSYTMMQGAHITTDTNTSTNTSVTNTNTATNSNSCGCDEAYCPCLRPGASPKVYSLKQAEEYRKGLEDYRKKAEKLKNEQVISKPEYRSLILVYKQRVADYKAIVKQD